jgi:2-amino-4-hydroxy-6-hydroxymethyldihydropteridine diphosphokinase
MTAAAGLNRVYLSLGSNIEPEQHLRAAIAALHAQFGDLLVSSVHRTEAVGFDGPVFLNLAVGLDTDWTPQQLDRWLHALEDRHGRRRDVERYSSRTLDIDIVLFGDLIVDGPGHLQIPRDELKHAFVLAPLAEIAPFARHPQSGRSISELWRAHVQRLGSGSCQPGLIGNPATACRRQRVRAPLYSTRCRKAAFLSRPRESKCSRSFRRAGHWSRPVRRCSDPTRSC